MPATSFLTIATSKREREGGERERERKKGRNRQESERALCDRFEEVTQGTERFFECSSPEDRVLWNSWSSGMTMPVCVCVFVCVYSTSPSGVGFTDRGFTFAGTNTDRKSVV